MKLSLLSPAVNNSVLEKEINQMVYSLYDLTEEEIGILEETKDIYLSNPVIQVLI